MQYVDDGKVLHEGTSIKGISEVTLAKEEDSARVSVGSSRSRWRADEMAGKGVEVIGEEVGPKCAQTTSYQKISTYCRPERSQLQKNTPLEAPH